MAISPKEAIEYVLSPDNRERIDNDYDRFIVYNGKLRDVVKKAISKEFSLPETVNELINRIIPINITQKIINKLSMVYLQSPMRSPIIDNPSDQELLDFYSTSLNINQNGKLANRFFKLHKHAAWEPFLDRDGIPRLRTLPSHTYTPISDDKKQPERPTAFIKHLKVDTDPKSSRYAYWSDENFFIVNGQGVVLGEEMRALNNKEGINPYGVIPFTYIVEGDDGRTIPISDDDLIKMQIAISVLLTDLAFASKYQLWSIFVVSGGEVSREAFNPNSIISLPQGADFKAVTPNTDIDKGLAYIEALLGMLLTTKNLSIGDISGRVTSEGASGIAKMLDRAETTEDRKDQQAIFINAEKEFWDKFATKILPWWVSSGNIKPGYAASFSDGFELSIQFKDPAPFIGDKDRIEIEKMKLDLGLTTMRRAIKQIHPHMSDDEVIALIDEINKESKERFQMFQLNSSNGGSVSDNGADTTA